MIRPVVHYPDPVLASVASTVETGEDIHQLVDDLRDTVKASGGAGLAAPQIGVGKRVFVGIVKGQLRVFINPTIHGTRGKQRSSEGCLSIPDQLYSVWRHEELTVDATNEHGKAFTLKLTGLDAVVVEHEHDHLDGITLVERAQKPAPTRTSASRIVSA